jgi:hypothetical protein
MKILANLLLILSLYSALFSQTKYWDQISVPNEITYISSISKDWDNNLWIACSNPYSVGRQLIIAVLNHSSNQWDI